MYDFTYYNFILRSSFSSSCGCFIDSKKDKEINFEAYDHKLKVTSKDWPRQHIDDEDILKFDTYISFVLS
jgi:hypothetical protein